MTRVRVVGTTLGVNRLECTHSLRLKGLLDCKGVQYEWEDLNQAGAGVRVLYRAAGKLFAVKRGDGHTVPLPQIFVEDVYVGGYEEAMSLEDCGMLSKLVSGCRCPHVYLHMFRGYVMESLFAFDYCPLCEPFSDLVLGVTDSYSTDPTQYKLWRDLLNSRLRFSVSFSGQSLIQGIEVTRECVQSLLDSGDLRAVIQKEKCVRCLRKTIMKKLCAGCRGDEAGSCL